MFQPESLYIEVSGICSAKCPYCVKGNGLQKQGKFIQPEFFRRILEHLKETSLLPKRRIVNLYVWGEPLLHPEINALLSIVKEYGHKAYISTFLPKPPNLSNESLSILHGVTLSLSGMTQESYGRIHGHKISALFDNFQRLMDAVLGSGVSWRPMVNWHRYRFNEGEMASARAYFEKAGALFAPTVADFNDIERTERFVLKQLSADEEKRLDQDLFTGYLRHCIQQSQAPDHSCGQWNRITLDERGNVLLCCGLANSVDGSVLGSIFDYDADSLYKKKTSSHLCSPCIQTGIAKYCDDQTRFNLDDFLVQHPAERFSSLKVFQSLPAQPTHTSSTPEPASDSRALQGESEHRAKPSPPKSEPLVSIGIPLYNEEKFIAQTLDSLLAQDYSNWETNISDDGSSDGSGAICQEYARKDSRIRYFRNRNNLGCVRNCNRLLDLANGPYFLWSFQHDLYHPSYLSRCLELMNADSELALCYSRTSLIDPAGNPLGLAPDVLETRGLTPGDRFVKLVREMYSGNMMFGLFRTDLLARTARLRGCLGHDLVLAAELSLHGTIAQIQEPLFQRRENRANESASDAHQRWVQMLLSDELAVAAPYLFMIREYFAVIRSSKLTNSERELAFSEVVARFSKQAHAEGDAFIKCARVILGRLHIGSQMARMVSEEIRQVCCLFELIGLNTPMLQALVSECQHGNHEQGPSRTLQKEPVVSMPSPASLSNISTNPSAASEGQVLISPVPQSTSLMPNARLPRISFVTIVLNGMPFLEYCLKAIYAIAHEIFIIEGAVEQCLFAANPDGSSKDGTVEYIKGLPDPNGKIRLIQGRWPEKVDMQNAALKHVTGDYVWLVDSDEIYKSSDLQAIQKLLQQDPSISQVNFIPDNFWKGFDYVVSSPGLLEKDAHFRRVFKFVPGAVFTSHRPPTMVWPGSRVTTEQMNLIDGHTTRDLGISFCHYSYVDDGEVRQKIELYRRYSWGQNWKVDLNRWYEECFRRWTPQNRADIEKHHPIWTADRNSRTERFQGTHPEVMRHFIAKFQSKAGGTTIPVRQQPTNRSQPTRTQLQLLGFNHYESGRFADALAQFDQLLSDTRRPEQGLQFMRGKCLVELGRVDDAMKALSAELEIQSNHPDAKRLLTSLQSRTDAKPCPSPLSWDALKSRGSLRLYAGDVPEASAYANLVGLSLTQSNSRHLQHDITRALPLPDQCVDSFQSEDVFEHIPYDQLPAIINEIYRVLKPGATFRLSMPDYGCDVLQQRSIKDSHGCIAFDPGGGGTSESPGHVWFPQHQNVKRLLDQTQFSESGTIEYLHYYHTDGSFVARPIDYSKGHIQRTPDHDPRVQQPYRPMSIVVDLTKGVGVPQDREMQAGEPAISAHGALPVGDERFAMKPRPFRLEHGDSNIRRIVRVASSVSLCEEARSLLASHKCDEAERVLQTVLKQNPYDPEACLLFREVRVYRANEHSNQLEVAIPSVSSSELPSSTEALENVFPAVAFGQGVQVIGLRNVTIGTGSCIGDHSWINVCQRDEQVRLKIGCCVLVGRQSMLSTGGHLEIGDFCVMAPRVYISDADHMFGDINQPIFQQGATLNRKVTVEENCWLGINTVISGNLTVGRGSVVAANSVVIDDVPPFCVVAGSPARIVKMYNPVSRCWERTRTTEDQQHIQRARESAGLPQRAAYQRILAQASTFRRIDPIAAGRGVSI